GPGEAGRRDDRSRPAAAPGPVTGDAAPAATRQPGAAAAPAPVTGPPTIAVPGSATGLPAAPAARQAIGPVITPHFRLSGGRVRTRMSTVDNDIGDLLVAELGPLGLIPDAASFERLFVSAVLSTSDSEDSAWLGFYRRSLARLE